MTNQNNISAKETNPAQPDLSLDSLLAPSPHFLLKNMVRIRRLEERCAELYTQEKIRGFLHLYIGEEAVATGVLSLVRPLDNVMATYREHGHALLKGIPARNIMAEMLGRVDGCCRGRGGSMHLFSQEHRFFGGQAIVGAGLPQAAGLALAAKSLSEDRLTFCFFGDGAVAEGTFHETMNLAALWKLPILFCCENNLYAMGTALSRHQSQTDLVKKAASYNITALSVDGMDPHAVQAATKIAIDEIREFGGPIFIEFKTYRFRAHSMFDPELYRTKEEVQLWKQKCPIEHLKKSLFSQGLLSNDEFKKMEDAALAEVEDAVAFAERAPIEKIEEVTTFVYAPGGQL